MTIIILLNYVLFIILLLVAEAVAVRVFTAFVGSGFTSNRGVFGNVAKQDTMLCVAFGKTQDVCFTGGANGSIYLWRGTGLSKCIKAHEGPCFAMHFMEKVLLSGCFKFIFLNLYSAAHGRDHSVAPPVRRPRE